MICSSYPSNVKEAFVLDTSVLINLHACRHGQRILAAIPNRIVVPHIVVGELDHETSRRNGEHGFLRDLAATGQISVVDLTDEEFELFFELTSTSPSLDDGEAATIAVAQARNYLPIIDERRGRARALMTGREPGWSLDLFRHPASLAALGDGSSQEALFLGLRDGRMRIAPECVEEVIAIIGEERSRQCTCLPGYRNLFDKVGTVRLVREA